MDKFIGDNIEVLETLREKNCAQNIHDFVTYCQMTLNQNDLVNWEEVNWPKVFLFTKKPINGVKKNSVIENEPLDVNFIGFAKSYVLYHYMNGGKKINQRLNIVFRTLEAALLQVNGRSHVQYVNLTVLDQCVVTLKISYTKAVAYACGKVLEGLVSFLRERDFLVTRSLLWKSPFKAQEASNRLTKTAQEARKAKLPDKESLSAIAEIFALPDNQLSELDLFISSVFALLMCAPSRVTEILTLPADCEIHEADREGKLRYGLRFYSEKGFGGNVKWIPEVMVPVAEMAIRRLKTLSKSARTYAREIEISGEDGELYPDFPWYDKEKNILYSNALCLLFRYQLSNSIKTQKSLFKPTSAILNKNLGSTEYRRTHSKKTIFDRHGYRGLHGHNLSLRTHQARHLLNTIAQHGGLGNFDLAKWSGRVRETQNRVYNHVSQDEMVQVSVKHGVPQIGIKPENTTTRAIANPSRRIDIKDTGHAAIHVTEFGYCSHDYVISPCTKFRDCINCSDHMCVKGDKDSLGRLEATAAYTEQLLEKAKFDIEEDEYGADKWVAYHEKMQARLLGLIALLKSKNLEDGALIRLDGNDFTHMKNITDGSRNELNVNERINHN
ncbi:hypothetical protein [Erwinia phyllosphaerae]|uniref:hypothetical protein n=1 Tax=Erwinia phyllosphaerae TaxID=2853256 RepID=UPI001FED93EB|nr:hypothetical protein [Erwinia phyllosphaerae]MBV4369013.1 hypothetical protein [Erwinia phyllosphaerae]